jgi:hypothetical protein
MAAPGVLTQRLPFDRWRELLGDCQVSAVHLEMRDSYAAAEDEDFTTWKAGHRDDPADRDSWWRPWLDLIAETTGRGVLVRRARIVSEPVSEYTRYLYDSTFTNIAAGEDVRWLPRRLASPIALPGNDFWLFDGRLVLFNHFDGDGGWAGVEWADDPPVVKLCASAFAQVWSLATPHADYKPS